MKREFQNPDIVKNEDAHLFEMTFGEAKAIIEYKQIWNEITRIHTGVEPELVGKGAATAVIEKHWTI